MTISTEVRKAGPFIGNDSASAFPFAFKVFKAADLIVVRRQDNIGEETTLTLDSDYHVTLNGNQDTTPGGVVALVAGALASGFTLVVSSELPYLQPTDLTNQGGFYPKVITNALDRLTIFCQQLAEITGRTLKLPITAPTNISAEIPLPNPSELIAWNETGTGLTTVSPQSLVTSIAYGSATADLFAGDGVTTTFPLSTNPASVNNLDVSVDGHSQRPVQGGIGDYSWNGGASITFASPPPAPSIPGDKNVLVRYMQAIPVSDSEALHAQTREALRRSYAEAGYNLVEGSFETGGTLASTSDVLLLESAGAAYAWAGAYPVGGYDVAPGIDPTVFPGFALRTDVVLRSVVSLTFPTIADIDESQLSIGASVIVENYSAACKSGVLFFKVAALGTGVHDGGKYITLTNYQLVQNLRKPFNVMAWGACGNSNGTSGNGADDRNAIYSCYKYAASSSARSAEVFFPRPDGNSCYRMGSGFEVNESDYTYFVGEGGHYTASKILVDFNGIAIYRNTGQFCNSFRNLVFQSANPAGYTAAAALYSVGTVESTLEEVSFLDFGGIACNLNACFGVRIIHPLVAGNYNVGLKLSGGNGNILDTPIFQDNLGTAGVVEGAGWTILNPYWENNCKRNDPATDNGGYYNLYVNATQTTIVGGTLNQYPQDTKVPIRIASADVTIINMNVYNLAATEVAHIESSSASLSLIGCAWSGEVSGYTANLFTSVTPLAGYRKADVTLSGRSVSDNLSSAWCNFNGTLASPISPRQGSNVSNITKLGTGTYRVNFQTAMTTNTYMVNPAAGGSNNSVYGSYGTKDAGFVEIYVRDAAGVLTDVSDVSVEVKEIKPL